MHGVLAADLIDEGRRLEGIFDPPDDIQVGQTGLDHHHVRAFGQVGAHFVQRLVTVGRVHLIGILVALAEVGGRAHRITKRAVVGAGVFRRVGHDAHVVVFGHFQRLANRLDTTIHHVRRRDHLSAGFGVGQRLADQRVDSDIVLHVSVVVENAVLAVRGERIESYVGDDPQLRETRAQGASGALGDALRVPGFGRIEGLLLQRCHRKQRQRRNAQRHQLFGLLEQQVDGQALHSRHRRHRLAAVLAVEHEHRQDQVIDGQHIFAHQTAGKIVTTIATQTSSGEQPAGRNETHDGLLARRTGEYDVYRPDT